MIKREEYEQLKAYARIDGGLVGVMWIVSFACFVGEFYNALFGFLCFLVGAFSLVFGAMRLKRFRDRIMGGYISFLRALAYSMQTYFCSSLLLAAAQYIYFQFIDHGFIISRYEAMLSTPEMKTVLQKAYNVKPQDLQMAMDSLVQLRPIEIALQFFSTNLILAIVISLPIAALIKRRKFDGFQQ